MTLRRLVPAALLALLAGLLAPLLLSAPATADGDGIAAAAAAKPGKPGKPGKKAGIKAGKKAGKKAAPKGKRGAAWPGGTVRFLDLTEDSSAVDAAVGMWNSSGVRVRFVEVKKAKRARLVLRESPGLASGCGTGRATLGYPGKRKQAVVEVRSGSDAAGQRCATPGQTLVLVRMLGRVLGLQDDDGGCAAMNSTQVGGVAPARCLTPADDGDEDPGRWMCSTLTSRDLGRAQALYGGQPKAVVADPWCDLVPRMPATGQVSLARDASGVLTASLQRLPEPALPSYLEEDAYGAEWEVHETAGACAAAAGAAGTVVDGDEWSVEPGQAESIELWPTLHGTVCFTFFAMDELGRYALAGSTAVTTVP